MGLSVYLRNLISTTTLQLSALTAHQHAGQPHLPKTPAPAPPPPLDWVADGDAVAPPVRPLSSARTAGARAAAIIACKYTAGCVRQHSAFFGHRPVQLIHD